MLVDAEVVAGEAFDRFPGRRVAFEHEFLVEVDRHWLDERPEAAPALNLRRDRELRPHEDAGRGADHLDFALGCRVVLLDGDARPLTFDAKVAGGTERLAEQGGDVEEHLDPPPVDRTPVRAAGTILAPHSIRRAAGDGASGSRETLR